MLCSCWAICAQSWLNSFSHVLFTLPSRAPKAFTLPRSTPSLRWWWTINRGSKLKVGDHFSASVLPSREGGKLEIKFRDIKLTVYGLGDYAFVTTADGQAILFKEGHSVVTVFAAHQQLQEGLTKTLKAVTGKAAKWRKGELVTFKASE